MAGQEGTFLGSRNPLSFMLLPSKSFRCRIPVLLSSRQTHPGARRRWTQWGADTARLSPEAQAVPAQVPRPHAVGSTRNFRKRSTTAQ